jgi:hypothetical protein
MTKHNELTANYERVERELNTKRKILQGYDKVKKGEIEMLEWKIEMQRDKIMHLEMNVEDVFS